MKKSRYGFFNMNGDLQDKVALVTGGAQGLGQAICHRLAMEGYHVAVADLNEEKAIQTAQVIPVMPGRHAIAIKVDVSDEESSGSHGGSQLCKNLATSTSWYPTPASSLPRRLLNFQQKNGVP